MLALYAFLEYRQNLHSGTAKFPWVTLQHQRTQNGQHEKGELWQNAALGKIGLIVFQEDSCQSKVDINNESNRQVSRF